MAADGLINIPSSGTVKATLDRLEKRGQSLNHHSLRTDRSCSGRGVGRARHASDGTADLRQCGRRHATMQAAQTIGIDLPLKALAWEDALGRVWLSYNDPGWLAHRHGLDACVRHRDRCHDRDAREHRAKRRGRAVPRGVAGRGRRGRLSPCHRHLIPCSIDLTRCSTDLIPCSIT